MCLYSMCFLCKLPNVFSVVGTRVRPTTPSPASAAPQPETTPRPEPVAAAERHDLSARGNAPGGTRNMRSNTANHKY